MRRNKLRELLSAMTPEMLRHCREWVPVVAANKANGIVELYQLLTADLAAGKRDRSAAEIAGELRQTERQLTRTTNQLLRILEKCLLLFHLNHRPVEAGLHLLEIYQELGLAKHRKGAAKGIEKEMMKRSWVGRDFIREDLRLAELEERHSAVYERKHRPEVQAYNDRLDLYYLCEKLSLYLETTNATTVLNIPYDLRGREWIEREIREGAFREHPLVKLYYGALNLVENPDSREAFHQLTELLDTSDAAVDPDILRHIYTYALNYCTRQITLHRAPEAYENYLRLNERLIERGWLLEDGELPPWRYSNMITVGLRTGRLEWARRFLRKYRSVLPATVAEEAYVYNLAHWHFYAGEFSAAQRLILETDPADPLLAVAGKNLLAKVYFETRQTELLLHFLEAYRLYVYRNALIKPPLKKRIRNFLSFVRRMAILPSFEKEKRLALKRELDAQSEMLEKDWLVDKLR